MVYGKSKKVSAFAVRKEQQRKNQAKHEKQKQKKDEKVRVKRLNKKTRKQGQSHSGSPKGEVFETEEKNVSGSSKESIIRETKSKGRKVTRSQLSKDVTLESDETEVSCTTGGHGRKRKTKKSAIFKNSSNPEAEVTIVDLDTQDLDDSIASGFQNEIELFEDLSSTEDKNTKGKPILDLKSPEKDFILGDMDEEVMVIESAEGRSQSRVMSGKQKRKINVPDTQVSSVTNKKKRKKRKLADERVGVSDSTGKTNPLYLHQRNLPEFHSTELKKKFRKNLMEETELSLKLIDQGHEALEEMVLSDNINVLHEESNEDVESETDSDHEKDEYGDNDVMRAIEEEEALFEVFGQDQVEADNCGVFGSGKHEFRFAADVHKSVSSKRIDSRNSFDGSVDARDGSSETFTTNSEEMSSLERERESPEKPENQERIDSSGEELKCISLPVPGQEVSVVVMAHPQELCIQGKAFITMVMGQTMIMGHKLQKDTSYKIYSPLSHSYSVLKTLDGESDLQTTKNKVMTLMKILGDKETETVLLDTELKQFEDESCVVIVVRPLDSQCHSYISRMSPYHGLFTVRTKQDLAHNMELLPLGLGLFPTECVMRPCLKLSTDIQNILDLWEAVLGRGDKSVTGRAPVILVCGGKNSGKSTLNRHLINTALNVVSEVNYLELDVGQTEFSPPGCVGLYTLSDPIFGPPFTHHRQATRLCYFGGVTASSGVSGYVQCMEFVFAAHKGDNPLIINTMGWNMGLGIKLLVDALHVTNPDIVIQINTYKPTDNFPSITPSFKNTEGWKYNVAKPCEGDMEEIGDHELCVVQTPVRKLQEKFIRWTAADHRNVTLLSYFCDTLTSGQTLLSLPPYVVSWSKLAVHVCSSADLVESQILRVLNGSIVGLCQREDTTEAAQNSQYPQLLHTFPVCHCIGFGLVRGIDPEKKQLYIVTPVTQHDLHKVNTLVKGSVVLPEQVTRQQKTCQIKPYWDNLARGIGSWKTTFKKRKLRRPGAVFRSRNK